MSLMTIKSGLTSLFLLLCLTACATVGRPPAEFLEDCAITQPAEGEITNRDVVILAEERAWDVERCNVDKKALRAWYEGYDAARKWRIRR